MLTTEGIPDCKCVKSKLDEFVRNEAQLQHNKMQKVDSFVRNPVGVFEIFESGCCDT